MAGIQSIRDNLGGTFVQIGVWMIVISFALFFGWGTVFSTSDANTVATVNGKKIDLYDLDLQMRKIQSSLAQRFEDQNFNLEEDLLKSLSINSLITDTVVNNYLSNNEVKISDLTAYRLLSKNEIFFEDGKFSRQKVENFARQNGILPNKYLSDIKKDIALNFWKAGLKDSSFVIQNEIERQINLASQTRDISFIKLNSSTFGKDLEITEEKALSFYNQNLSLFQTEEEAKVRFVEISLEDLEKKMSIEEADVQREYEAYIQDFDFSIRRSASHLMIKINEEVSEAKAVSMANDLKKKISSGEDFEVLVAEYSEDEGTKNFEGNLGVSDGSAFPKEFEIALLDLKVGEISGPVVLDRSVHLLKLTEVKNPEPEDFESMKGNLKEDLEEELATSDFLNTLEVAADLTFSLNNLDALSEEMQIAVKETDFFSKEKPAKNFSDETLLEKIFSDSGIQEGQLSELIELNKELAVIFEVVDFKYPKTKDFENVKELVKKELRTKLLKEQMVLQQSKILSLLKKGETLQEISNQEGLKVESYKKVSRDSSLFPRTALLEIFNTPRSSELISYSTAPLKGEDRVVFTIDAINDSSEKISNQELESFQNIFLEERSESELLDLQSRMLEEASITRNKTI